MAPQHNFFDRERPSDFKKGHVPKPMAPFATAENGWLKPTFTGRHGVTLPRHRTLDHATETALKETIAQSCKRSLATAHPSEDPDVQRLRERMAMGELASLSTGTYGLKEELEVRLWGQGYQSQ